MIFRQAQALVGTVAAAANITGYGAFEPTFGLSCVLEVELMLFDWEWARVRVQVKRQLQQPGDLSPLSSKSAEDDGALECAAGEVHWPALGDILTEVQVSRPSSPVA